MSKLLLLLLGAISLLGPFSLDLYVPALPAIAADLRATAVAVQLTPPVVSMRTSCRDSARNSYFTAPALAVPWPV